MSDSGQDKVTAFDALFTNSQIQMLKIFLPYFDPSMQKRLAIYIKWMELQYTIRFFQRFPYATPAPQEMHFDMMKIAEELLPYSSPADRPKLEEMRNMFQTMEQYKSMMEMVQTMKELFPEGEEGGGDIMSGLAAMAGMPGMGEMMGGMNGMAEMMSGMGGMSEMMNGMAGMNGMAEMMSSMSGMKDVSEMESVSKDSPVSKEPPVSGLEKVRQVMQAMAKQGGKKVEREDKSSGVDE